MEINTTTFIDLLQHPQVINKEQTDAVKSIIDEFPYFQSARAIHLKGLKNKESFKYNQELKITAAYTTDRSILFDFITSKSFLQDEISQHIKQNIANLKEIEETPEEKLEIGKPLTFNKSEVHSFVQWLKTTSFEPIIREQNTVEEDKIKADKFKLIDKFIASNPKIKPIKKDAELYNIANTETIPPESIMTETLARIYVEQKNYTKAIQSYKILSLKYPEKSSFFAHKIQAIKELQEQGNI